jgi:tRNA1Val (adenine37-N6)-methyltransferase
MSARMTSPEAPLPDGETLDTFYHGRIRVLQRKKGYRFSVDAPLLADFIRTRESDEAIELGTGNGIISLLLSVKPFRRITALEIQAGLAGLAVRNIALNGLEDRIEVVCADLRTYEPGRRFGLVFANPPYIRKATGFLSRSEEKSAAKHELHGDIRDVLRRTAEWLAQGGRACFVYPEKRRADFLGAADENGLSVRRARSVHPREGEPANLFLVELVSVRAAVAEIMPPLVLFGPAGKYTEEAEAIFSGP